MSHISERTNQKTRLMIFRAIRTMLHTINRDIDDDLLGLLHVDNESDIIKHLLRLFQLNPLFTREFYDAIRSSKDVSQCEFSIFEPYGIVGVEWEVYSENLAANPSWDLHDILPFLPGDPQELVQFFLEHAKNHPQFIQFMIDQGWSQHINVVHGVHDVEYRMHPSITQCVNIIHTHGDLHTCMSQTRVVETMLQNPDISFGMITEILMRLEYGEFRDNPFAIHGVTIPILYTDKPNDLQEILAEIFANCDLETIVSDHTKHKHALICLLTMISKNKGWDVNMDAEFGDRVWHLIKIMWDNEWEKHKDEFIRLGYEADYQHRSFEYLKDLTQMWNPNWFVPDSMTHEFQESRGGYVCVEFHIIARILNPMFSMVGHTPGSVIYLYESHVLQKDMLRIQDVKLIGTNGTIIYNRENFTRKVTFRGEYGMIIGRFLFKKMIIPMRRKRATRVIRNVLSRLGEKSGRAVSSYSHCVNCIASFITA